jgi:hypothetical protein
MVIRRRMERIIRGTIMSIVSKNKGGVDVLKRCFSVDGLPKRADFRIERWLVIVVIVSSIMTCLNFQSLARAQSSLLSLLPSPSLTKSLCKTRAALVFPSLSLSPPHLSRWQAQLPRHCIFSHLIEHSPCVSLLPSLPPFFLSPLPRPRTTTSLSVPTASSPTTHHCKPFSLHG